MKIELRSLLLKLNTLCRNSLESAVRLCMLNKRDAVELTHFLIKILEQQDTAFRKIIKDSDIDSIDLLQKLCNKQQNLLANTSTTTPSISKALIDVVQDSWLLASVEFNSAQIHSGHILYTILSSQSSLDLDLEVIKLFRKIDLQDLKGRFQEIVKDSNEVVQFSSMKMDGINTTVNSALERFTTDLVDLAKNKLIDRAIGREDELSQVIDILCRRKQNNPILVGEAGVGKTAIVEELASKIVEDLVPDYLKDSSVRVLDLMALQAGANIKGEFEQRLKDVLTEIKQSPKKIILFIDEIHNIIGTGSGLGNNDAANLLKPALARSELLVIGATTWGEYKKYFEKDAALTRRFHLIKIKEPSEKDAISIARNVAGLLEEHHGVKILDSAIESAVKLSSRYMVNMQLPDKAISLLDSACTRVKLEQSLPPVELQKVKEKIFLLDKHIKRLEIEGDKTQDLRLGLTNDKIELEQEYAKNYTNWENELNIVNKLKNMDYVTQNQNDHLNNLEELKTLRNNKIMVHEQVDSNVIANILSAWTEIPIGEILKSDIKSILSLEKRLQERVIGQDHAIKKIVQNIRVSKTNIADPNKPTGVFLLVGESGVGKTETALSIASYIYGSDRKIITINMSEYKEPHKISTLIGSPPGYVGYGEGGRLTEQVRRNPYSVVLLDEMEKAHTDVQELFLQVFDKGVLTDSEGLEVNFKNSIIIMTSNLAAHKITEFCQKNKKIDVEKLKDAISDSLTTVFKPEFLGRISVIPYLSLSDEMIIEITKLQLEKLKHRLFDNYKAKFIYSADVINKICQDCKSAKIGARIIEHIISGTLLPDLSIELLTFMAEDKKPTVISLSVKKSGKFCWQLD